MGIKPMMPSFTFKVSNRFEIQFIISVNINEAKLCFDLGGFEPRTYGSAVQHPNH